MKKNKMFSCFAAVAIMSSMMSNLSCISAEESTSVSIATNEMAADANQSSKIYTLEQLFAMRDEDFLKLEGAKSLCDEKLIDSNSPFKDTTGTVYYWLGGSTDNGSYSRGNTEKELSALLGNTVNYKFIDPVDSVPEDEKTDDKNKISYSSVFEVEFPDYAVSEEDMASFDNIKFAKCHYCVNQIIPTKYIKSGVPMGIMYQTSVKGDMDGNDMVDLADATSIAKYNVGIYPLNSAQILVGDMNGDGVIDSIDLSTLIEMNLGK